MENENGTYNQNTQSDDTQQNFFTKILTNAKSFIELLPIASILLSLVVGFIALRDEILANIKSIWYGIPSYYFVSSNLLKILMVFIFLIAVFICVYPIIKVEFFKKQSKFMDFIPLIMLCGIVLMLYMYISVLSYDSVGLSGNLITNWKSLYIRVAIIAIGIIVPLILVATLPESITYIFPGTLMYTFPRFRYSLVFNLKKIKMLIFILWACFVLSLLCYYMIFLCIKNIESNTTYELVTNTENNTYDVVITNYDNNLVVMKGYSRGNTLFICKSDGYRVIERSGDQTIKFLNFEKVEFLLRE
ncbi:MAG: hypothetical protein D8H95_42200 [Lachnospiraceae bacterium]|jgi:membrane protein|nr:MAG: hypothetical protein D8H95_42200 [Lachnospiraceae bacterium]